MANRARRHTDQDTALTGIEALLFDLGGVIIEIDGKRVFRRWARQSALSVREIANRFRMDEAYERHERGELTAEEYFAYLRSVVEYRGADEAFMDGWNAVFVRELKDTVRLLPDLKAKMPLYLLTNSNPTHEAFWRRTYPGIIALFTDVFVSSTLGHRKPDPSAFQAVADRTGVELKSMLFFDDTIENIEGARAAGLQAIHVAEPADVKRALLGT